MKGCKLKGSEANARRAIWLKLIQEYQISGQSQTSFCKQRGISRMQFLYYLTRLDKKNLNNEKTSFMPIEVDSGSGINMTSDVGSLATYQDKWVLNIADNLTLELPPKLSVEQISQFILILRKIVC